MPGNENYDDSYMYITAQSRARATVRGRGRGSRSRAFPFYEGGGRPEGRPTELYLKDDDAVPNLRRKIKASQYENFVRKHPGGTKMCLLCKMDDGRLNCQGVLKWFSVKSKRGPGRPKDNKQPKPPRLIASFLSNLQLDGGVPKVVSAEGIKIKIDMSGGEVAALPNGNGYPRRGDDTEPLGADTCGFYLHVECCKWATNVAADMEMVKAERLLLRGLGQTCSYCGMHGATVCCRQDSCKKKFHLTCSLLAKCVPDILTSTVICSEHLGGGLAMEVTCSKCKEDKCHNSMLHCLSCGSHTHKQCLSADVQMRPMVVVGWQCHMCRTCNLCTSSLLNTPPSALIDCLVCCRPFHVECLDASQRSQIINGLQSWRCQRCTSCSDCGREVALASLPHNSNLPVILCSACCTLRSKGVSCCVCFKAIASEQDAVRCEQCRAWIHPACESIDQEVIDQSTVYLCPVCRQPGKSPIVNKTIFTSNGHMIDELFDENSQDSMSIASETEEMTGRSLTPLSSHNSPGSSSLESIYTVLPSKKSRMGGGGKLGPRPNARKLTKLISGEGSYQEKRDGLLPSEPVLYNEKVDPYTHHKDVCKVCGSIGLKEDGHMLICQQCSKCYHAYCVNKTVTDTMLKRGWRCSDCLICDGCRKPGDGAQLLLCEDCDISFHTYCLTPPLDNVPTGPWRCSWCVKCLKCQKTAPGVHSIWYQDYTVCGPCHSTTTCLVCVQPYSLDDFCIKCSSCDHMLHGRCEQIQTEDAMPKKFVCSRCEDHFKREGKVPPMRLPAAILAAAARQGPTQFAPPNMSLLPPKAREEEIERKRGSMNSMDFDLMKAMSMSRSHVMKKPPNCRITGSETERKMQIESQQGPSKELINSQTYQQIIRDFTGGPQAGKLPNKRGKSKSGPKNTILMSPNKEGAPPKVRGRPRGSRNKPNTQRKAGKGGVTPEILQQMAANDANVNFTDYVTGPQMKSPVKTSPEALLSTVQCLPQRYREIMMRSSQPDSQELKISRHPNTEGGGGERILYGPPPPAVGGNHKVQMRGGPPAATARAPNQLIPQIMGDPKQMIKTEVSPGKLNSAEIAANFFGEELVPPPPAAADMMSPPMGPPMGPPLTSPVMAHPGKPHFGMKPRTKPPPSPLLNDGMQPKSIPPSPTLGVQTSPRAATPIKREVMEPIDLSKINLDEIHVCPETPPPPDHPDTLPEYNNRELLVSKPGGQEVEEEEKTCEAVSSIFSALFGDEDLELDEPAAKGSPIFHPPDPNTEQKLTLKKYEEMDEGIGELPSEVNAILESIEANPIGTEIDEIEPWKDNSNSAQLPDLDMADELLQLEGFDFPEFFDDLTMKKLESAEHRPTDRPDFDKMLEPPKRPTSQMTFKTWEEEERKGPHGLIPQLLFAHNNPELSQRRVQCSEKLEWYKLVSKAFTKLSKEERNMYATASKKNRRRKETEEGQQWPYDEKDQEILRQNHRRQRLFERSRPKEGEPMMWAKYRAPDDNSGSTVTVGPIKGGVPNQIAPSTPGPMVSGPMTPGPMTAGPMTPGPMTPGPMTPGPMTPGPVTGPIRSPMTPRGMSPMQMMQAQSGMPPQGYMRQFDPNTGQWVHTGAHTPLRHMAPAGMMGQPGMAPFNPMEQFAMQPAPPEPAPKPTKKRTKKKKEKVVPVEPQVDQVNLENFPPHLRFDSRTTPPEFRMGGPMGAHPPGGPPNFEINDHLRQTAHLTGGMAAKQYKQSNSPMLKSPSGVELERPKSLNLNNSPSATPKSNPNTPNKGASKNSSPLTKQEDFSGDSMETPQQIHQKQALRMALEQRKQQQHAFLSQQMIIGLSASNHQLSMAQFVQFRLQQDWLKKWEHHRTHGGAIPPPPTHPGNMHPNQIQMCYNRLMENVLYSMAGRRVMMQGPSPADMPPAEEEKKPKPKKRKKKKTETPKKDDKVPKMGPNLMVQTAMGAGPLGMVPPDGYMAAPGGHPGGPPPAGHPQQPQPGMSYQPVMMGMLNQQSQHQKHLNMRSPGPASAGPHANHYPGQQGRLPAPNSDPHHPQQQQHLQPPHPRHHLPPPPNSHFHSNYEIEPPRTSKPQKSVKAKAKSKESYQLSVSKGCELPLQAGSPRFNQYEIPRYQHQIKVENNQDFSTDLSSSPRTPGLGGPQTPGLGGPVPGAGGGVLLKQDPLNRPPLTPTVHSLEGGKRRKRKPKAETDGMDRPGPVPARVASKNMPTIVQPDIARMVELGVRGRSSSLTCRLTGSYGRALLDATEVSSYRELRARLKRRSHEESTPHPPPPPPPPSSAPPHPGAQQAMVTVLTPQQEKMLCQKFGVSPAEAQRMYYFQQHKHLLALKSQIAAGEGGEVVDKSRILDQIRQLQESREKHAPRAVKQESSEQQQQQPPPPPPPPPPPVVKPSKPMLELTKPTPPTEIKQEPRAQLPFTVGGNPEIAPTPPKHNPPTDEKSTRVINLRNAFQMLSDFLGMKLKKLNLASLNELRVQNIVPGALGPQNLLCYNCGISLHPNKLKTISAAAGKPYYGIKDEHGGTFCCDSCLAHYYCKKFSSLRSEGEPMPTLSEPPPLRAHPPPATTPGGDRSPGKRRRESESWRYWRAEDVKPIVQVDQAAENKRLLALFAAWHDEWTMKVTVPDKRVCLLCGSVGDGLPNGTSRLLNYGHDKWIHLNCALWSNDVYETRDGTLANVPQMCKRAQDTVCSHCGRIGATVGCFKTKCSASYHFLCARHSKCTFYPNKSVYCSAHKVAGLACSDFLVRRRVVIDRDLQQLLTNEAFREPGDQMKVGPITFHHPGHILNNTTSFHSRHIVYPFAYSATRVYWSTERPKERLRYHCTVDVREEQPLFRIEYDRRPEGAEKSSTVTLEDDSCDLVWGPILDAVVALRAATPDTLTLHRDFHSGSFLHGLSEGTILRVIEGLPGVEKLDSYTFCYGRIETVTLEHLVPFNPTQSARTEKYSKHSKRVGGHRQVSSSVQNSLVQTSSPWTRELASFQDMLPYQKSFNRASQYRRLKTEWKLNVLLRRSGIQGLGLYARRFIERNTMVIEYVGQLIRTALCDLREIYYNSKNIGCYMFKIDDVVAIDATMTGGPARYINHSCEPNCVAEIVTFEREKKIIIISNRKIRQGEELTYDYKFDFEDDSEKIPCNCGSVVCRKWMN